MPDKPSRGLADVVAASTGLSDIDGRAGRLSYRGYGIHDLAGHASFEEIGYLLPDSEYVRESGLRWVPLDAR